jgi:hypothetical protein
VLIDYGPAAGARVWIWNPPDEYEAFTNDDGWYEISNVVGRLDSEDLILAEWGDMRGGVVVDIGGHFTTTVPVPDIILSPR